MGNINTIDVISAQITALQASINAIPVLTETGGTLTTDGTEQNVYINDAPAGVYQPRIVSLDFTRVRTYYRETSGGGYIKRGDKTFAGVQDPLSKEIILRENRYGIKVTIEKTAGANKAYIWEVFYKV